MKRVGEGGSPAFIVSAPLTSAKPTRVIVDTIEPPIPTHRLLPTVVPPELGPLDAVSAVIFGALGAPASGGPLTAHRALQLSREAAARALSSSPPLSCERLEGLLAEARAALGRERALSGVAPRSLSQAYVHLAEAETFAQAVLDEAIEGLRRGPSAMRARYEAELASARALLSAVGAVYARRCPEFTKIMLGDAEWPPRVERVDGKLVYTNGMKSVAELDLEGRRRGFEERLQKYLAAGGRLDAVVTLDRETIDRLEVGERYEYVLTTEGKLNFALIPKAGDGPSPGHTLTAEQGAVFRDTRAWCAGELWISRGSDGELSGVNVSTGSGHYKPSFESISTVDPFLVALGVPREAIVHYGGPSSARDAARSLLEKLGLDGEGLLPMRVHDLRLALHHAG